jgi:hypothetical protein
MNRQLLENTFAPDQIKQRNGSFGRTLDYIEGHSVIQRLNEAFDGCWSFEIISHDILDEEVMVQGKLSADGVVKTQFGSSSITRAKDDGGIISLAADLKAAATDSLKKCATLLGVGLYLYGGLASASGGENIAQKRDRSHQPSPPAKQASNTTKNDNGRVSNKQLSYLVDLGKEIGLDSKGLDQRALDEFGVKMAYLTRKEASAFIDSLKKKAA